MTKTTKGLATLGAAMLLSSTPAAFAQTTSDPAVTTDMPTGYEVEDEDDDSGKWGLLGLLGLAGLLGLKRRDRDEHRDTHRGN